MRPGQSTFALVAVLALVALAVSAGLLSRWHAPPTADPDSRGHQLHQADAERDIDAAAQGGPVLAGVLLTRAEPDCEVAVTQAVATATALLAPAEADGKSQRPAHCAPCAIPTADNRRRPMLPTEASRPMVPDKAEAAAMADGKRGALERERNAALAQVKELGTELRRERGKVGALERERNAALAQVQTADANAMALRTLLSAETDDGGDTAEARGQRVDDVMLPNVSLVMFSNGQVTTFRPSPPPPNPTQPTHPNPDPSPP